MFGLKFQIICDNCHQPCYEKEFFHGEYYPEELRFEYLNDIKKLIYEHRMSKECRGCRVNLTIAKDYDYIL